MNGYNVKLLFFSTLFPIACFLVYFLLFFSNSYSLYALPATSHMLFCFSLHTTCHKPPAILFVFLYTPHAMSHLPCFIAFSTRHTLRATCYFICFFLRATRYEPPAIFYLFLLRARHHSLLLFHSQR